MSPRGGSPLRWRKSFGWPVLSPQVDRWSGGPRRAAFATFLRKHGVGSGDSPASARRKSKARTTIRPEGPRKSRESGSLGATSNPDVEQSVVAGAVVRSTWKPLSGLAALSIQGSATYDNTAHQY